MIKFSWSQKVTLQTCQRQYKHKYITKIVPKMFNQSLSFGKLFHSMIADLYLKGFKEAFMTIEKELMLVDTSSFMQSDYDELRWQEIVLNSMLLLMNDGFYKDDCDAGAKVIEAEVKHVVIPKTYPSNHHFKGIHFEYIPDLVLRIDGKLWLVEYKTASRLGQSYFDRLVIDEQTIGMMNYLEEEYGEKFAGRIFRVIKKPAIRQKKSESSTEFFERLSDVMQLNYSDYFTETKLLRDDALQEEFKANMDSTVRLIRFIRDNEIYHKDTSKCTLHNCPYLPLCSGIDGAEFLFEPKKERKA